MRKTKRLIVAVLTLITAMCMCGFATNTPKLNIDKRPVYARCNVSEIISDAKNNYSDTSSKYKDVEIIDAGVVKSIEKNQKTLTVKFLSTEVKVKTDQKSEVAKLSVGSNVTVYGKFDFESEKKKTISINADHLINEDVKLSYDYYLYGGKRGYSIGDSTSISLADNRIKYMIPNDWVATEAEAYDKIFNSKIYSDQTGKCYYINRVFGNAEPEVFCIFYFDNNYFLEKSGNKDKTEDIEKEIINNICPKEKDVWKGIFTFPTEESTSANGVEFDHYVANFDNYRIEFAFTPVKGINADDNGGICVVMHMYIDDSIRPDDVLYVMNSLIVSK